MARSKPAGQACQACPLKEAPCVRSELYPKAKLVVCGEAPGHTEVERGIPFCGASGRAVEKLLPRGLSRSDVSWTNAVLCKPERDKQLPAARKACFDRLQGELLSGPHIIVATGAYALQSAALLKRRPKIQEWRGSVIDLQKSDIKADKEWQGHKIDRLVLPTIHPAFVMRSPLWAPVIHTDFERIGRVLRDGWIAPEKHEGRRMLLVNNVDELRELLKQFDDVVAIDVETTGLGATSTDLVCLSISDTRLTIVCPWSMTSAGTGHYWGKRQVEVAMILTAALRERSAITHNGPPFDHIVLKRSGIVIEDWDDTLLAHHAFASHMPKRLSHVATMYLDVPPWKHEKHNDNLRKLYFYNGRDSLYTALSWREMQRDLQDDVKIYENDRITAELCRTMQVNGFKFDRRRARTLSKRLKQVERELTAKAVRIYGKPIDLLSRNQLKKAFFEDLGAPAFFYSEKTGEPSLNVDTLRAYTTYDSPELRDLALCVINLRKAQKTRSTYVDAPELDEFDRVHATWKNFGAVSGRFAASDPNLMNLTRKANDPTITHCNEGYCEGKIKCKCSCWRCAGVRGMYIAEEENLIVGFDAKQLEMRIAAYISGDEVMMAACETSDLHAANAEIIWGEAFTKAPDDERKRLRDLAKQSGFAVAYLAEAATVHARIIATGEMLTLRHVEDMLDTMRDRFSTYYQFQADLFLQTIRLGYVETPIMGRKREVGHAPKPTEIANAPVQGGAADVMNLKLPKIADRVRRLSRKAKIIAQVHDAGVFEVPTLMADDVLNICKEEFDKPVRINGRDVVFPLDLKKGHRWSEL